MSETNRGSVPPKFHSPAVGATISLDTSIAVNFEWIPGQAETVNVLTPGKPGQEMVISLLTSGVTSYAVTLGTNFSTASVINTGNVSGQRLVSRFISNGMSWIPISGLAVAGANGGGWIITKMVTFTENATNTLHTGTVTLPAGAWLHNIQVTSSALWGATTAVLKVGDTADDDGYFIGVNVKATDLVVGEVLNTDMSECWGGKQGAYLVAASGQRGPVATNFGKYYAAGSNITGIITVGTPAVTTGRTYMVVAYSLGENIAAVASA